MLMVAMHRMVTRARAGRMPQKKEARSKGIGSTWSAVVRHSARLRRVKVMTIVHRHTFLMNLGYDGVMAAMYMERRKAKRLR